jgi:glutathione S-transferase
MEPQMSPTITAFATSPDRGTGHARDMRVRWALEEVGQSYDVRLVSFAEMKQPAHRALQPFGQIPTFEEGDLALFDSSAIVLHLAETHPGLFPADPNARARAITWVFAAVTSIEPLIVQREVSILGEGQQPWHEARLPLVEGRIRDRLADLSTWLGDREWLAGSFSAADLIMVSVLRRNSGARFLPGFPNLAAYVARGESRPAFQRAYAAQLKVFEDAQVAA